MGVVVCRVLEVVEWELAEMTMREKGGQYVRLKENTGNDREKRGSVKMMASDYYTRMEEHRSAMVGTYMSVDAG